MTQRSLMARLAAYSLAEELDALLHHAMAAVTEQRDLWRRELARTATTPTERTRMLPAAFTPAQHSHRRRERIQQVELLAITIEIADGVNAVQRHGVTRGPRHSIRRAIPHTTARAARQRCQQQGTHTSQDNHAQRDSRLPATAAFLASGTNQSGHRFLHSRSRDMPWRWLLEIAERANFGFLPTPVAGRPFHPFRLPPPPHPGGATARQRCGPRQLRSAVLNGRMV
jgi:hypothetical protein